MSTGGSRYFNQYRTHNCNQLRADDVGANVKLSGWVHRKRDHGSLLFIDIRDHYGITQCVIDTGEVPQNTDANAYKLLCDTLASTKVETIVSITGKVVARDESTINKEMDTGDIEVVIHEYEVLAETQPLPFPVNSDKECAEEIRLAHRFLDLRREKLHNNIKLRSAVINSLRQRMHKEGFTEFQTPILTASSPEGARDFLVPSRMHPGKFYALPQAPQQFKQLLMVAGFDRYFQIAPCFRDEDARADRSPGEFYQLDMEMSFVTQEDVFEVNERVFSGLFDEFAKDKKVSKPPFRRIEYKDAMEKYGSDKPDLRNPLIISKITDVFVNTEFSIFVNAIKSGSVVLGIGVRGLEDQPRSFFDKLNDWARSEGQPGLGYITFAEEGGKLEAKGPISKFLHDEALNKLKENIVFGEGPNNELKHGDAIFLVCSNPSTAYKFAGKVRTKLAEVLSLIDENSFEFCWIVDFPMYEYDEKLGKIEFSHNPFSMPQGGLEALLTKDPLEIKAYQYDFVCNGVELSSGAIRNHLPEIMYKAFEIAGYPKEEVENRFGGMLRAFQFGAPPHGGIAPGVDRVVMLLAGENNLREIVAFPMNQQAQDLLMQAPNSVDESRLKELHIKLDLPIKGI